MNAIDEIDQIDEIDAIDPTNPMNSKNRVNLMRLPERYAQPWREPFDARVVLSLVPGVCILDVGCGRRPTILPEQRPAGCHYVGLDLSRTELAKASPGSYDEMWESDVARWVSELEGRFDLVVSWQVLEHVKPLDEAMENLRSYLRPGGRLVALLSGTFSAFGLINQVVPQRLGVWAMCKLLRRDPATVFPAYYHCCWHSALTRILDSWREAEVVALYRGAGYFGFSPLLQRMCLKYEEWALCGRHYMTFGNLETRMILDENRAFSVSSVKARTDAIY